MTRHVLIPLLLTIVLTRDVLSAPAKYDQRQDGKFNVHAKLENFLIVVASSGGGDGGLLGDLASQALEFKNLASRPVAAKNEEEEDDDDDDEDDPVVPENDKEPYRVEIVRVQKDESHQLPGQKGKVKVGEVAVEESGKTLKDVDVSVSGGTGERKDEIPATLKSIVRKAEEGTKDGRDPPAQDPLAKNLAEGKIAPKPQEPTRTIILDEQGDASGDLTKIVTIGDRPEKPNSPGLVKRSVAKELGTSVKKELSGRDKVADGDEDDLQANRPDDYKLLTDGPHGRENCGPTGYRDNNDLRCKTKKHAVDKD